MDNKDRLDSYAASGAILIMRRSLRSAGRWSVFWGCLWVGIFLLTLRSKEATWISYVWFGLGGVLLLAEGVFVIRTFSSWALKAEATTLAAFGGLNLYYFGMLAAGKSHTRANPLFGLIMLVNAYNTWKSSTVVDQLMTKTNDSDLAFMSQLVDDLVKGNPRDLPDLIVLKQTGMTTSNPDWRMKIVDGTAFLANISQVFGTNKRALSVEVIPVRRMQIDISGETWIGNKSKCRLIINGEPSDKKFEIEKTMLERVQMQGIAASAALG